MLEISRTTSLNASAEEVWTYVTTSAGVNYEFWPVMRMTFSRAFRGQSLSDLPLGKKVGRSWLLLFGFLPIDYDDLTIAEVGPGFRFLERSSMMTMPWQHERRIVDEGSGCRVTDTLTFQARRPLHRAEPVFGWVVSFLFKHRHRRLERKFS